MNDSDDLMMYDAGTLHIFMYAQPILWEFIVSLSSSDFRDTFEGN